MKILRNYIIHLKNNYVNIKIVILNKIIKGEDLRAYGEMNRKPVSVVTGNEPTGAKRF